MHKKLSPGNWQKLSLAEQIGNIGSELARAKLWNSKNLPENKNKALERALELIDFTLAGVNKASQLKEITRLREAVESLFLDKKYHLASFDNLEKFYMPFAILARR